MADARKVRKRLPEPQTPARPEWGDEFDEIFDEFVDILGEDLSGMDHGDPLRDLLMTHAHKGALRRIFMILCKSRSPLSTEEIAYQFYGRGFSPSIPEARQELERVRQGLKEAREIVDALGGTLEMRPGGWVLEY